MDLVKSEISHPQKRPRAIEPSIEEISQEVAIISSTITVGASSETNTTSRVQDEVELDGLAFDGTTTHSQIQDSSLTVSSITESDRERPVTESSDIPPQKRHRFIRP